MLNELGNAIIEKTAKYKITHVSISHDKTRLIVDMDVELMKFGMQKTVHHIWVVGNDKDILKNKWILVRVIEVNKRIARDERITLSDKTKNEIWNFVLKDKDKIERGGFKL